MTLAAGRSSDSWRRPTVDASPGVAPASGPVKACKGRMSSSDPFNLERFVMAQAKGAYEAAVDELRSERRRSHWTRFIFPQMVEMGRSATAQYFAISGLAEARAYLRHPTLGPRVLECARILTEVGTSDPVQVMGPLDALKLRSSMTLFTLASPDEPIFGRVLDTYFDGAFDPTTKLRSE